MHLTRCLAATALGLGALVAAVPTKPSALVAAPLGPYDSGAEEVKMNRLNNVDLQHGAVVRHEADLIFVVSGTVAKHDPLAAAAAAAGPPPPRADRNKMIGAFRDGPTNDKQKVPPWDKIDKEIRRYFVLDGDLRVGMLVRRESTRDEGSDVYDAWQHLRALPRLPKDMKEQIMDPAGYESVSIDRAGLLHVVPKKDKTPAGQGAVEISDDENVSSQESNDHGSDGDWAPRLAK